MKKLLAFLLVLVMILSISLVACDKKAAVSDDDDDDDAWGNGSGVTDNNNNNNDNTGDGGNGGEYIPPVTLTWEPRDDKIYVAQNTYLRASAKLTDTTRIVVTLGEELSRKGTATNGDWDKVEYAGETYYIMKYVTVTNKASVTFKDLDAAIETTVINEFETGESQYALRTSPCYKKAYKTQLDQLNWGVAVKKSDGTLKVLALSLDETWAKVEYKNKEYYVQTYCLEEYADNSGDSGNIPDGPIA